MGSTEYLASWIDRSHHLLVALQVLAPALLQPNGTEAQRIASTKVDERKAVILAENGARIEIEAPERDVLLATIEVFRLDLLKDPAAMN